MQLPQKIAFCLQQLEEAGYAAYVVGGCVRDDLLGLVPHDYDICTAAPVGETSRIFEGFSQVHTGKKHGTVGVVLEGELVEITTFRTEGGYADSRHPGWVEFVTEIEADLARRDFTVNAMAYSPTRGLCDPFGGAEDLKNHNLRAVGKPEERFREDALRILRGLRFAASYGLAPEEETLQAMFTMAAGLQNISAERIFAELDRALPHLDARLLTLFAPIFGEVIPELRPTFGFDQHSPHHAYDLFTHIAHVAEGVPPISVLRWTALLHDIGKPVTFTQDATGRGHFYGHAGVGAEMADKVLRRLKAPTALRERVVLLIAQHMTLLEPEERLLKKRLAALGEETMLQLLALQDADFGAKGKGETRSEEPKRILQKILAQQNCLSLRDLAVKGNDLMALGMQPGKALGETLNALLNGVLEEKIPNEREALLAFAKEYNHLQNAGNIESSN